MIDNLLLLLRKTHCITNVLIISGDSFQKGIGTPPKSQTCITYIFHCKATPGNDGQEIEHDASDDGSYTNVTFRDKCAHNVGEKLGGWCGNCHECCAGYVTWDVKNWKSQQFRRHSTSSWTHPRHLTPWIHECSEIFRGKKSVALTFTDWVDCGNKKFFTKVGNRVKNIKRCNYMQNYCPLSKFCHWEEILGKVFDAWLRAVS